MPLASVSRIPEVPAQLKRKLRAHLKTLAGGAV